MQVYFKPLVRSHRQRSDGNYSVVIRLGYKSKYAYIPTPLTVSKKDLKTNKEIKNQFIVTKCNEYIAEYRQILLLADDMHNYNAMSIRDFILVQLKAKEGLDFIELMEEYIELNKNRSVYTIAYTTLKHLKNFAGDSVMVDDVTPRFLSDFEKYLSGKVSFSTTVIYMSRVRVIFNWIIDEYEYQGFTFVYPFRKYKIKKQPQKKPIALTKEQIHAIIDIKLEGIVPNIARDVFMMSMLLLGINAVDLFNLKKIGDRIEYERTKTKTVRDDRAYISVKVEEEVKPYLNRHLGAVRALHFSELYNNHKTLNSTICIGLRKAVASINEKHGEGFIPDISYYQARRTVASVMRNKLNIPMSEVAQCLNHVSQYRITDIYIEENWDVLDRSNRMFIDWLYK